MDLISSNAFSAPPNPASASATIGASSRRVVALGPRDLVGAHAARCSCGGRRPARSSPDRATGPGTSARRGSRPRPPASPRGRSASRPAFSISTAWPPVMRAERRDVVARAEQLPQPLGADPRDACAPRGPSRGAVRRPRRSTAARRRANGGRSPTAARGPRPRGGSAPSSWCRSSRASCRSAGWVREEETPRRGRRVEGRVRARKPRRALGTGYAEARRRGGASELERPFKHHLHLSTARRDLSISRTGPAPGSRGEVPNDDEPTGSDPPPLLRPPRSCRSTRSSRRGRRPSRPRHR